jgi:Pentapeptide repeats (8 copies)
MLLVFAGLVAALAIGLLFSSEAATGATLLAGVLVAVGTFRTIQVTREGQVTERFTRAIDQLGCKRLEVHLGAIYALERIAKDSPKDRVPVMEILTAYVREHAAGPPESQDRANAAHHRDEAAAGAAERTQAGRNELAKDVQAVIAVLGRREADPEKDLKLDLRSTHLMYGMFAGGKLGDFRGVLLQGAHLERAKLVGTQLEGACLQGAYLQGADLEGADLRGTHLEGADLSTAVNLEKANLQGAVYDGRTADDVYPGTRWPNGFRPDEHGAKLVSTDELHGGDSAAS